MKVTKYNHCEGLNKVPQNQQKEVERAIANCPLSPGLRMATKIRKSIFDHLVKDGWSQEVSIVSGSGITISSLKNNVGLCLQTGNMSRMYADILKLQKLYIDGSIKAGIMVIPASTAAKALGSNIANASRLFKELEIFRKVVHMPIIIYSFE